MFALNAACFTKRRHCSPDWKSYAGAHDVNSLRVEITHAQALDASQLLKNARRTYTGNDNKINTSRTQLSLCL